MSQPVAPPDTAHFTCVAVHILPVIQVPSGFGQALKLCPDTYFRHWTAESDPRNKVYTTVGFKSSVQRYLDPVVLSGSPIRHVVYCWAKRPNVTVTWEMVYASFPKHGPRSDIHQVVPWQYLRQFATGWYGRAPIVPRDEHGVVLIMGDAGCSKPLPTGGTTTGTVKELAQLEYSAMVGAPTWNLSLPNRCGDPRSFPDGARILTVLPYSG